MRFSSFENKHTTQQSAILEGKFAHVFFLGKSHESALAMFRVVEAKNNEKRQSAASKWSHTTKKYIKNVKKIRIDSRLYYD